MSNNKADDWLLTTLAGLVTTPAGIEFGITLFVGGATLSGMLTSGKNFIEHTGDMFEKMVSEGTKSVEAGKASKATFTAANEALTAAGKSGDEHFLHLKDARVHIPGKSLPTKGPGAWIRIRASEVDGYFIGMIGSDEQS